MPDVIDTSAKKKPLIERGTSIEELQSTNAAIEDMNAQLIRANQQLEKEIEERRRAEKSLAEQKQRLRTIIDSEPAWVNVCDAKGNILEVNPAGVKIMEAESQQALIGRKLIDLVAADYQDELLSCRNDLLNGKVRKHAVEVTTLKGNTRWLEISTVNLPSIEPKNHDDEIQMMSIICDQTQFKQAQDRLLQRQEELAQLMRFNTLGAMASGLAHELNQPLSAIANYISGCERRVSDNNCEKEEVLEVLQLTNSQVQRAGDIINQVKHFIQQDDIKTEIVDVNSTIYNTVKLIQHTGQSRNISIEFDLQPQLAKVLANFVQIEQVIINLVLNGIEAMHDAHSGQPKLVIRSRIKNNSHVEVCVEDRGKGMSEAEKINIFKPFHTTKAQGMGMGLCISRTIIELYMGQLSVSDRKHGGTIFSFILPIHTPKPYKETT